MPRLLVADASRRLVTGVDRKILQTVDGDCPAAIGSCCFNCYAIYYSQFSCDAGEWSAPVGGDIVCLPTDPFPDQWIDQGLLVGDPPVACIRQFKRLCASPTVCNTDTDCDACSPTPPDPPGDDVSDGCCDTGCPCVSSECSSCAGHTPTTVSVSFFRVQSSPKCSFLTVDPFEVWQMRWEDVNDNTYVLESVGGCVFCTAVPVKVLQCLGDGSGCDACTPDSDVTISATLCVDFSFGSPNIYVDVVWTYAAGVDGEASARIRFGNVGCCEAVVTRLPAITGSEAWTDPMEGLVVAVPLC